MSSLTLHMLHLVIICSIQADRVHSMSIDRNMKTSLLYGALHSLYNQFGNFIFKIFNLLIIQSRQEVFYHPRTYPNLGLFHPRSCRPFHSFSKSTEGRDYDIYKCLGARVPDVKLWICRGIFHCNVSPF